MPLKSSKPCLSLVRRHQEPQLLAVVVSVMAGKSWKGCELFRWMVLSPGKDAGKKSRTALWEMLKGSCQKDER